MPPLQRTPDTMLLLLLLERSAADEMFGAVDLSVLVGAPTAGDEAGVSVGCQPQGWGAAAAAPQMEVPGAGTASECMDIAGTRSVCSTPALGAEGCEVLANTAGCTCSVFCEHHGLVCTASWDDNFSMCIKRTEDQSCEFRSTEQICLCAAHESPPLLSAPQLVALIVLGCFFLVIVTLWIYCHGAVPECKLWHTKKEKTEIQVRLSPSHSLAIPAPKFSRLNQGL